MPGRRSHPVLDLVKIILVPGGKIIEPYHPLAQLEQGLKQIGTDEAGNTGHQPSG